HTILVSDWSSDVCSSDLTGNFVKIVQRLPVRIELEGYDPDKRPLFIGTSVVPYVYINKPPTGPDAGKFLQAYVPRSPAIEFGGRSEERRVGKDCGTRGSA